jgi:peptide/nickel transport system substrate-binding protein
VYHIRAATPDYREGLVTDQRPLSLNPLVGATDPAVRDVGELLYRRLLRLDRQASPAADLATGYSVSPDGLTYHLPLTSGQLWSDGHPITSADVIATVDWVQSSRFGDTATAAPWRDVHVRDDGDGVSFDLAGPRASFAAQLTQLPILPLGALAPAQLSALRSTAASAMATSGPLRVVNSTAASITLFPNPHAATGVRLNQVEIDLFSSFGDAAAAFRARSVDAVVATDPAARAQLVAAGGTPHDITTFRFVDLLFNERTAMLADPAVRQAIAASIDRSLLVSGPLHGMAVPEVGAVPAGVAWATPHAVIPARDVGSAAATLDSDGWRMGPDGVRVHGASRLHLGLAVADVAPLPDVAASIQRQLFAAGIDVTVSTLPAAALTKLLLGGVYDLAIADWDSGPDPDVSSFWRSTAVPPAGFNVSGGQPDPFLDQALDRVATLSTPSARASAALAVSSQLADDLPGLFLETPQVSMVVRPGITVVIPPVGYTSARYDDIIAWHRG